jgi:hypothetical protein
MIAKVMDIDVLPLNFVMSWVMYNYQKQVFEKLGLGVRKNRAGFFAYVFLYRQCIAADFFIAAHRRPKQKSNAPVLRAVGLEPGDAYSEQGVDGGL